MIGGPTSLPPDGGHQRSTLRLEHWAVVASAADLARKATALADRYDALPDSGDAPAPGRRESVARLRAAAASAQLLITSLMGFFACESPRRGPAPSSAARRREPADVRAAMAARRDRDTEARDLEGRLAARDERGQAAGRVPSPPAEVRAARHGLRERLDAGRAFHQAQGMLMARSGMSAAEAFEVLLLASVNQDVSLFETAGRVVQEGS